MTADGVPADLDAFPKLRARNARRFAARALFSRYTRTGRALRAVADGHQAALSVATKTWFACVLARVFRMFRPQGLFGERLIGRV